MDACDSVDFEGLCAAGGEGLGHFGAGAEVEDVCYVQRVQGGDVGRGDVGGGAGAVKDGEGVGGLGGGKAGGGEEGAEVGDGGEGDEGGWEREGGHCF